MPCGEGLSKRMNELDLRADAPRARWTAALALLLAALVFGALQYYLFALAPTLYTADSYDSLLWANATLQSGTLLNADFYYACHLPTGGNLLLLPFVAVFDLSLRAQVWGMWFFTLLFSGVVFFLLRQMGCGWKKSCVVWALLVGVLLLSAKLRELMWGHILYYNLGLFYSFLGLGLVFGATRRVEAAQDVGARAYLLLAPVFLLFLLAAVNQAEILVLCNLPVLAALAAERFFCYREEDALRRDARKKRWYLWLLVAVAAATAAGYALGSLLARDMMALSGQYANGYLGFSKPSAWPLNLVNLLQGWIVLLGFSPEGMRIMSPAGIGNLLVLLGGLVLAAAPVAALVLYRRIASRAFRCLILFHWFETALLLLGWVFGGLGNAEWRLTPAVATAALITALLGGWVAGQGRFRRQALLIAVPLLLLTARSLTLLAGLPTNAAHEQPIAQAAQCLEAEGLTYGYATFWNATPITVLTEERVRVRNVEFTAGFSECVPYLYQAGRDWYEDQPGQARYFVLLTQTEYDKAAEAGNPLVDGAAEIIDCEPYYKALVFDENIF